MPRVKQPGVKAIKQLANIPEPKPTCKVVKRDGQKGARIDPILSMRAQMKENELKLVVGSDRSVSIPAKTCQEEVAKRGHGCLAIGDMSLLSSKGTWRKTACRVGPTATKLETLYTPDSPASRSRAATRTWAS